MAGIQEYLKAKWGAAPPTVRKTIAIVIGVALFSAVMMVVIGTQGKKPRKAVVPTNETNMLLPTKKDVTVEKVAAGNAANEEQIKTLKDALEQEKQTNRDILKRLDDTQSNKPANNVNADVVQEMMNLKNRIDGLEKENKSGPAPKLQDPLPPPVAGGSDGPSTSSTTAAPTEDNSPKIRVLGGDKPVAKKEHAKPTTPLAYMPAGSMFEAILLNGMDAPTSQVAQKNPVPAVMRVKTDALLPNFFTHDVKECFVLVSGFGVMSSERAQLRTESYSCIRENGQVLEGKLDGYVIGEDGRVGARGRLVSKQGQLIARSLASGILSGIGQALTPTQVPQLNLSPGSSVQTQTTDLSTVATTGVARGFSDTSRAVAGFYLELAKETTPVIEIDAGRKLTIALIKGVEFK